VARQQKLRERTMTAIITVQGLAKRYAPPNGPLALNGIDLQIQEGEIFSLLGPNGAGKTTLIAVLCGLLPPSSGDAVVAGHSVVRNPMAVKQVIGVIPEEIALYSRLSARQNLRYFGLLYGMKGEALQDAVNAVLAVVGLTDRADDRVGHYSSGMKRRLNVAVGLLHNPRIVFMDEPTVGLDPESRRRILDLVLQLNKDHQTTILYTTHRMEEAQELSHRVGIIHQGRIVALGTPDELIQAIPAEDTLRLDTETSHLPPATLDALRRVRDVKRIVLEPGAIVVSLRHAAERLPCILDIAQDAGISVRSVTVQRPNLESVFLHLTGQRLTGASG
jgi:ABC-2 type transport system ATP-binding protein